MIKTVSFAPPRARTTSPSAVSNRPAAKSARPSGRKPLPVPSPSAKTLLQSAPVEPPAEATPIPKQEPAPKKASRLKRAKVPENLAEQYGAKVSKRVEVAPVPIEDDTPKKRLSKAEREARRALMQPDEVLARLQRAHAVPARPVAAEKRSKGWKFQCGRCGATSYFQTAGAICACGALAIKE